MKAAQQWQQQGAALQAGQFAGAPQPAAAAPTAADPVAQLEKLQSLKEKGALTDAEFETEKAKILGGS
jgi:membrane protease subunit (stomatin/prohibitin family)